MRGDVAERAGGILLLVVIMVIMIALAMPMLFASEPVTEQYSFLQLCAFWASTGYDGETVVDGLGVEIPMNEPCRKALGLTAFPNGHDWDECKKRCPAYRPD